MTRWLQDDREQKLVRDLVIGPGLYGPYSVEGRYVYIDKGRLATILQRQFAVDTIIQSLKGNACCVEEKICRWPGYEYSKITLETMSCTVPGRESVGWMRYGQADVLNYALCQADGNVLCHLIDFQRLKEVFWREAHCFRETKSEQSNRTVCRIVPLRWIRDTVGVASRLLHATAEGKAAVLSFNGTHYRRQTTPPQQGTLAL